jgi:hypothetical protein
MSIREVDDVTWTSVKEKKAFILVFSVILKDVRKKA